MGKRWFSLFIAFCLCLLLPLETRAADISVTIDTGHVTLKDTDGDGYYEIGTADELYAFAVAVNRGNQSLRAILVNDITVNAGTFDANGTYTAENGETVRRWTPIGNDTYEYSGTFNGNHKTISGLYFLQSSTDYIGLFGYVTKGGTIQNVTVKNSFFKGDTYVGGIVGYNNYGTITNCCNQAYLRGKLSIGGVAGENYHGTITNCCNSGKINGELYGEDVGGIAGSISKSGSILNCYNIADVSGSNNIGGIVGRRNSGRITNCYNIGTVSGKNSIGGIVGNLSNVENCYYLDTCGAGGSGTAVNAEQVANGEVAYGLGESFGQTLSGNTKDAFPVLGGTKVNYGYTSCDETQGAGIYTNEPVSAEKPAHADTYVYDDNGNGTHTKQCSVCRNALERTAHTLAYTISGTTITESCHAYCGYTGSATLHVKSKTYDGFPAATTIEANTPLLTTPLTVTYAVKGGATLEHAPTDAGTYTASFTLGDKTVCKEFTISPYLLATPTIKVETFHCPYTGSAVTPTVTVWDGETMIPADEYHVSYADNINAGQAAITITDKSGGNYTIVGKRVFFIIDKAVYSGATTVHSTAKYGNTGTVALDSLVMTGGTVTIASAADSHAMLRTCSIQDNSMLSFSIKNDANLTGKTATLFLSVQNCKNYEDYTISVTISVSAKSIPKVTAPTAQTLTYNGTAQPLITAGSATGGTMQYSLDGIHYSMQLPLGQDAGSYTVYYKVVGNHTFADIAATCFDVNIRQAVLTITAENKTVLAGGAMPEWSYTVTGLLGEDTLTKAPILDCEGDLKTAGTYAITARDAAAGRNYTIEYQSGTLTVSNKPTPTLTLTPSQTTMTGGGAVTLTVDGLPSGETCTVTCDKASYQPTEENGVWSVSLPNATATYTFTVTFAGNDEYSSASTTCTVSVTKKTESSVTPPTPPTLPTPDPTPNIPPYIPVPDTDNINNSNNSHQNDKTETVKNPDGSTTTTITDMKTDTVTKTTTTPTGTTVVTVMDKDGNITKNKVFVSQKDAATGEVIPLPMDKVNSAATSEEAIEFTVEIPQGSTVTIEVPVRNPTLYTVVIVVDKDGKETIVPSTRMTENGVSVTLKSNTTMKIVENVKIFEDVTENDAYYDAVIFASSRGITAGTSEETFSPSDSCTRAQIVTFLWRAAGCPTPQSTVHSLTDVEAEGYYGTAVLWALENGITNGTSADTFHPDAVCTMAQAATFLYRAKQVDDSHFTGKGTFQLPYTAMPTWCYEAVAWCLHDKIIDEMTVADVSPYLDCTRAQIVTFLYRALR